MPPPYNKVPITTQDYDSNARQQPMGTEIPNRATRMAPDDMKNPMSQLPQTNAAGDTMASIQQPG